MDVLLTKLDDKIKSLIEKNRILESKVKEIQLNFSSNQEKENQLKKEIETLKEENKILEDTLSLSEDKVYGLIENIESVTTNTTSDENDENSNQNSNQGHSETSNPRLNLNDSEINKVNKFGNKSDNF